MAGGDGLGGVLAAHAAAGPGAAARRRRAARLAHRLAPAHRARLARALRGTLGTRLKTLSTRRLWMTAVPVNQALGSFAPAAHLQYLSRCGSSVLWQLQLRGAHVRYQLPSCRV